MAGKALAASVPRETRVPAKRQNFSRGRRFPGRRRAQPLRDDGFRHRAAGALRALDLGTHKSIPREIHRRTRPGRLAEYAVAQERVVFQPVRHARITPAMHLSFGQFRDPIADDLARRAPRSGQRPRSRSRSCHSRENGPLPCTTNTRSAVRLHRRFALVRIRPDPGDRRVAQLHRPATPAQAPRRAAAPPATGPFLPRAVSTTRTGRARPPQPGVPPPMLKERERLRHRQRRDEDPAGDRFVRRPRSAPASGHRPTRGSSPARPCARCPP